MTGLENPKPIGARHRTLSPVWGSFFTIPDSVQSAARLGPRHCGQSLPKSWLTVPKLTHNQHTKKDIPAGGHELLSGENMGPIGCLSSRAILACAKARSSTTLGFT